MQILSSCEHLLTHWGGHPAAVGLSVSEANLEDFKKSFVEIIKEQTNGILPERSILIDTTISEGDLHKSLVNDLNRLSPFGHDNPEPILALKNIYFPESLRKLDLENTFVSFLMETKTYLVLLGTWQTTYHLLNYQ